INPGAKLSGTLLEDEKALNTAHIAFGNNEQMSGGLNKSLTHRDFLFYNPSINITYKDGTTKILNKNK
ncbi:MAG: peptidase M17, partial [Candidatus Thorarchaeota archaeon]